MNTVCANCQALNRIPDDRIEDGAKCGRCGHELFDGDVINATGATLDKDRKSTRLNSSHT